MLTECAVSSVVEAVKAQVESEGRSRRRQRALSANIELWCKKNSRSDAELSFNCHILAPVKQLLN